MRSHLQNLGLILLSVILSMSLSACAILENNVQQGTPAEAAVKVEVYGDVTPTVSSGFILQGGYVLTTAHGISDLASEFYVSGLTLDSYVADLVAMDTNLDVALLKIIDDSAELSYQTLGNSDTVIMGQRIWADSASGSITGVNESVVAGKALFTKSYSGLFLFDAPIGSGSSGGPLMNMGGQIIGLIIAYEPENEQRGYALPINRLKPFLSKESIDL